MQLTCNHPFEPGLSATIKVKETEVFLTASPIGLREHKPVGFPVKKLGKEFLVYLLNSDMSFLTNPVKERKLSPSKVLSLFANNPGRNG